MLAGDTVTVEADDDVKIYGEDDYVDANDDVKIMANHDETVDASVDSSDIGRWVKIL